MNYRGIIEYFYIVKQCFFKENVVTSRYFTNFQNIFDPLPYPKFLFTLSIPDKPFCVSDPGPRADPGEPAWPEQQGEGIEQRDVQGHRQPDFSQSLQSGNDLNNLLTNITFQKFSQYLLTIVQIIKSICLILLKQIEANVFFRTNLDFLNT